jgi:uncharacterized phage infection (PIP) family protein YhgE
MEELFNVLSKYGKKAVVIFSAFLLFGGGLAAWDQVMSKYALGKDVVSNSQNIGGLITLQEQIIKENRRQNIRARIDKLDDKIMNIEEEYQSKEMEPGVKVYYRNLKSRKRELEQQLK